MKVKRSKIVKKKWALKGITWKIISIPLGAGVVHWLTGETKLATDYLVVYTPISLVAYFFHEMAWQWWKIRKRKKLSIKIVEVNSDEM
jgi:uncharacterized membrane protein